MTASAVLTGVSMLLSVVALALLIGAVLVGRVADRGEDLNLYATATALAAGGGVCGVCGFLAGLAAMVAGVLQ